VALEDEAKFLRKAVRAKLMDADKGTAALYVFSQLKQMGAQFSFGQFLVERGLLSQMALEGLSDESVERVETVSEVGDYKLIELLAEGQSGAVFRAIQQSLRREVALKILSPSAAEYTMYVERFLGEARATAKLNHPNIVQGIDVGSANGLHYFAMELVEGGSARALLLKNNGGLPEDTVLRIGYETADGLKAAHTAGIIHHDLKPDNLLLTREGHVKIADLGISQDFGRKSDDNGEFWASPHYAAPERVQGSPGDQRSDIYSLGATLYELLAGQPPFNADKPRDILQMHVQNPLPDLHSFRPDISVQTGALVRRMLAKNPDERVTNAQMVMDAIERIIAMRNQQQQAPPLDNARATPAGGVRPPTGRNTPTGIRPLPPRPGSNRFPPRPGGNKPSSRFKPRRG